MSTIILNLNDSVVSSNTIVEKSVKAVELCKPCIKEAETNDYDLFIVVTVCGTIIIVAFIVALALVLWQNKKMTHDEKMAQDEATQKRESKKLEANLKKDEKVYDFELHKERAEFDYQMESKK